jgi:4-hydroxymandelate oxidase
VHPLLTDQQTRAARALPEQVRDYIATGAGDQSAVAEASWSGWRLRPHVLRDVTAVDTSLELLGSRLATPVLVAPTALHGLVHPDAETATARGTAAAGSLLVLSTRASRRLEDVPAGRWWFQAYVMRDRGLTRALVQRAAAAGASAVVVTGDTPYLGIRPAAGRATLADEPLVNLAQHLAVGDDGGRSSEQDPSADLECIAEIASAAGLPVLVKGVLRGDDAQDCVDAGAAGVVVSNHGGRQLDHAVPTSRALPEVADALAGRVPLLADGGIRSGNDILTALALGADAVLLGRPVLWALAADGADGVQHCLEALTADLAHVMALAGARTLPEVTRDLVTLRGG